MTIVLITGCSDGGIGSATAKEFHRQGCRVIATARRIEAMGELSAMAGVDGRMKLMKLDVCSAGSVEAVRKAVVAEYGHVDILVNNAGILTHGPVLETPIEDVSAIFDTNVTGVLRMAQAFVPLMIERRKGLVVNIGSITGIVPNPFLGVYAATKKALHSVTETLRQELYPFDVKVLLVAPGLVRTKIEANAKADGEKGVKEGSLWTMVEKQAAYVRSLANHASWTPDDLAKPLVAHALKASPPAFYTAGTNAMEWKYIVQWLPEAVVRWFFVSQLGLARMRKDVRKADQKRRD